jgi:hypothetical protein
MSAARIGYAYDTSYPEVQRALPALAVAVRYPLARQYGPEMRYLRSCGQFEQRRRAWNREAHRDAVLAEARVELAYWLGFRFGYDAGRGGVGRGGELELFDRVRAVATAHDALRIVVEERGGPGSELPMRERWRQLYRSVRAHPEDQAPWMRRLVALATEEGF